MSKSIAELRTSSRTSLPRDTIDVCVAQGVVGEIEKLSTERAGLERDLGRIEATEETSAPRKMSEGLDPRVQEYEDRIAHLDAELEALYDEMREHTGTVTLQGIESGAWRLWADANPPREDKSDEATGSKLAVIDVEVGRGYVNATALLARLGDFVAEWNGDPVTADEWTWLTSKVAPGDLKAMGRRVVEMHEGAGKKALPKSSTASSTTPRPASS